MGTQAFPILQLREVMQINFIREIFLLLTLGLFSCASLNAEVSQTENTFKFVEGTPRIKATLADAEWLVGSWDGEAFGSKFEQTWNPASNGSMVGMFKLLDKDKVAFYELLLLVEEEGSLSLKVKHFSEDFTAWEDRSDYIKFPLVKMEENALHFSGLSFNKISDTEIDGYIVMRNDDKVSEHKLTYKKVTVKE